MSVSSSCSSSQQLNITQLAVVRTLGEGAFGEVKLLIDRNDPNIAIAVKIIDLKKHRHQADNVRREALLQRILRHHPNVLKYISMRVNVDEQFQIFLEYADGGELFDRIEPDVGMHPEKAKFYFAQLIDGLEYIHGNGITHRDIKPENLLLTRQDVLKISDFGMATIFRHDGRERYLDTRCGTMPYVAPEVLTGRYRGVPVDIWSSGVVLVAMLVGELPWESPERSTIRFKCWVENKALNRKPWKRIPNSPLSLLKGMLDPDPKNRFTISRILNHPWFEEESEDSAVSITKQRRFNEHISPFSQPTELHSMRNSSEMLNITSDAYGELSDSHIQVGGLPSTSFSQPDNIESLLINHSQLDPTQTNIIHPLQKLARRMTRFCVIVSVQEALASISKICVSSGFQIKRPVPQQIVAVSMCGGKNDLSFIVTMFEMKDIDMGHRMVMADFRRSKGDGLQFKRIFMNVKRKMDDVICKDSYDWLVKQDLLCSEGIKSLKIDCPEEIQPMEE
ncbi:protein kinase domain-containing protein [Ditylenchus destructor]|uniref:non-specific serine/threonine protein kinase n=1 Tax=Ditylenchus destructor TaxID=166010 RepID=A0AAD4NDJ9_9BILA|nr:protein kinase domain-containing protein [Ditylenchus destructor]